MKPDLKQIAAADPETIYTLEEAAKVVGTSSACIRKWGKNGKLAVIKIGGRYFVKGLELKKMVVL